MLYGRSVLSLLKGHTSVWVIRTFNFLHSGGGGGGGVGLTQLGSTI